jgi:hypothetical protein
VARLDWHKARDRDRAQEAKNSAPPGPASTRRRSTQQMARAAFVDKHGLRCFKCGAEKAEWAKTGLSERGAWAICVQCVGQRGLTDSK